MMFIYKFSSYSYIYLLHEKSMSFNVLKNYKVEVENQLSKRTKSVRFDCGGEYYGSYDNSSKQPLRPFTKFLE